ncbi:hypothetical protein SAMN05444365_11116 [Micromonospora pattaloongensis]|uniref:Uncharacterized protein n=1 Tax=Micromonospora pattaloongensis TaxID=405436 RepID=A0A1H3SCD1_9ACTN|nr:hypothetical protein [Micromonospora pattaloongensis]SDZ35205.1 hypothetical protein SAMN05444365_11116 [Micromonospora pattaloongensis]
MDALDQLAPPATELLGRVDDLLVRAGAPTAHPIWPLLRRVRALPGDAVGAIIALRPAPLAAAGSGLRVLLPGYAHARATLADRPPWDGPGADAFDAHRGALAADLDDGADGAGTRLAATGSYLDELAGWAAQSRTDVARALAAVIGSAQAVEVVTGDPSGAGPARAAAEIGAVVLVAVADTVDRADALLGRWGPLLGDAPPYRSPAPEPGAAHRTTRLAY